MPEVLGLGALMARRSTGSMGLDTGVALGSSGPSGRTDNLEGFSVGSHHAGNLGPGKVPAVCWTIEGAMDEAMVELVFTEDDSEMGVLWPEDEA